MHLGKKLYLFSLLAFFALLFSFSIVFADWDADITPPTLTISPSPGTYQAGRTITLSITASDPAGIESLTVTEVALPSPPTITNTPPTSQTYTTYTYNWTPDEGDYTITIGTADSIGNAASQSEEFSIITGPTAWIQTTGGDVHSNTGINAPGGP